MRLRGNIIAFTRALYHITLDITGSTNYYNNKLETLRALHEQFYSDLKGKPLPNPRVFDKHTIDNELLAEINYVMDYHVNGKHYVNAIEYINALTSVWRYWSKISPNRNKEEHKNG